eukprot:m.312876 g.312876  ORF g.312876 m.312876 type:complete len:663 (+) comp27471_c0_seq1:333-2321(+)
MERVGTHCVIEGLVGRPELNGMATVPESLDPDTGRLRCPVTSADGYTEYVALKPGNVIPGAPPPASPPATSAAAEPTGSPTAAGAADAEFVHVDRAAAKDATTEDAAEDDGEGEGDEDEDRMPQIFSTRKPKDMRAGASSAAKSVAKGILGGVTTLFAAPIIGAREGGVKGFVKGVGAGVVAAVALPVAGICVGAVQFGRGVANTPTAMKERHRGRFWDERKRQWVDYDPKLQIEAEAAAKTSKNGGGGPGPKETGFYELLEVEHTASEGEIKKSYYKLARAVHPDRNPAPEAKEHFQKLSQAYQVLSDPALREQYDLRGEESVSGSGMMDGAIFFTMLFGSDRFAGLIGELYCAATARLSGTPGSEIALERAQMARVAGLAEKLVERLATFTVEANEAFLAEAKAEAEGLSSASFGGIILESVGLAYESAAIEAIGGIQGFTEGFRSFGRSMGRYYTAASSVAKVISMQSKMEARAKKKEKELAKAEHAKAVQAGKGSASTSPTRPDASTSPTESARSTGSPSASSAAVDETDAEAEAAAVAAATAELLEEVEMQKAAIPTILRALWSANSIDIAKTLKMVCKAVLYGGHGVDPVTKETRLLRAKGMLVLGKVFRAVGATSTEDMNFEAFQESMFNAAQQDAESRDQAETARGAGSAAGSQ